eukprot:TRINITY_DN8809_c0_g1_i5.p1 TRINITY_DN8809_c0_g1~~TRINITY_DN8809_c0_g1_i5.p1  ORF type:complete len:509 (+),score=107.82 TRINITY_DN8809_c0_g1_i5:1514-3040(+)
MASAPVPEVVYVDDRGDSNLEDALLDESVEKPGLTEAAMKQTPDEDGIDGFEPVQINPVKVTEEIHAIDINIGQALATRDFDTMSLPRSKAGRQAMLIALTKGHHNGLLKYVLIKFKQVCSPSQLDWLLDNVPAASRQFLFLFPQSSRANKARRVFAITETSSRTSSHDYQQMTMSNQDLLDWALRQQAICQQLIAQAQLPTDASDTCASGSAAVHALLAAGKLAQAEQLGTALHASMTPETLLWCYVLTFGPTRQCGAIETHIKSMLEPLWPRQLYAPLFHLSELLWQDVAQRACAPSKLVVDGSHSQPSAETEAQAAPEDDSEQPEDDAEMVLPDDLKKSQGYMCGWISAMTNPQEQFILAAINGLEPLAMSAIAAMQTLAQVQVCVLTLKQNTLKTKFPFLDKHCDSYHRAFEDKMRLLSERSLLEEHLEKLQDLWLQPQTFIGFVRLPRISDAPVIEEASRHVRDTMGAVASIAESLPEQASQAGRTMFRSVAMTAWRLTAKPR